MKNFVQPGDSLDLVAPSGGVTSGVGIKIGGIFAVASVTALVGETFAGWISGVYDLAAEGAVSGQDVAAGAPVYWDVTNKRVTKTSAGNTLVGFAVADKATADTTARVLLIPRISEKAAGLVVLTEGAGAIGGSNDGDLPTLTATTNGAGANGTVAGTLTGTVDGTINDVAAAAGACAGGATPTAAEVDTAIATATAALSTSTNLALKELMTVLNQAVTDNVALRAAIRENATKINAIINS